jgi:hypothetical protein
VPSVESTEGVADAHSRAHTIKSPAPTVPLNNIDAETLAVMLMVLMALMVSARAPACTLRLMLDCSHGKITCMSTVRAL